MSDNLSKEFDDQFDNMIQLMWSSEPTSSYNMFTILEKFTIEKYGHANGLYKLKGNPKLVQDKKIQKTDTTTENLIDIFEEDLKCVICSKITVSYGNQLMECDQCHLIYHQNCHTPLVDKINLNIAWTCHKCVIPRLPDTLHYSEDNKSCDSGNDEMVDITNFLEKVKSGTSSNDVQKSDRNKTIKKVFKNTNKFNNGQSRPGCESRQKMISLKSNDKRQEQNASKTFTSKNNLLSKNDSNSHTVKAQFRNTGPSMNIVNAEKRLYYMKKRAAETNRFRR